MRKRSLTITLAALGLVGTNCATVDRAQAPPSEESASAITETRTSTAPEKSKTIDEQSEMIARNMETVTSYLQGSEWEAMKRIITALASGREAKLKDEIEQDLPQIQNELLVTFWSAVLKTA